MKQCKVALLGYGIAGQAFSRILVEKHNEILANTGFDVRVTAITTGSRGSFICPEGIDLVEATRQVVEDGHFDTTSPWYSTATSMEVVKTGDYDVVMELTPIHIFTGQPAIDHMKFAMERGKHAITANKGPIAWAYEELKALSEEKGVCFFYETTVMAGMPVFNMAAHCLQYCKVSRIRGILNATTNYVLRELEKGLDMETILINGRKGGFMEADPSIDLQGWDATAKLTALMNVLMGANTTPDQIERIGVEEVSPEDVAQAKAQGCHLKLLCEATIVDGKPVGTVKPTQIPADSPYCGDDVVAVVTLDTDLMGELTLIQYGLETTQTGYGVFIDLIRVLEEGQFLS